jgi:hypothetical protein
LSQLIWAMDGELSHERDISHDQVIREKLSYWDWKCSDVNRANPSFVRRSYPATQKIIKFAKGRMVRTKGSWPPYERNEEKNCAEATSSVQSRTVLQLLKRSRGKIAAGAS